MLTQTQLKEVLDSLPVDQPVVEVECDAFRLIATVTSPSFASLDEADRQALVWGHLIERLGDYALGPIEFVFTNAPGEVEAAE